MNYKHFLWLAIASFTVYLTACEPSTENKQSSITQREFTWTFDKEYEVGQFINGDWWVVGPVVVTSITPSQSVAKDVEYYQGGKSVWGDPGLKEDSTVRNGSVVVDTLSIGKQGFDSRGLSFDSSLAIAMPYSLKANSSIISSQSNDTLWQQTVYHKLMWEPETKQTSVVRTVSVLTCLDKAPPADAFRPAYAGTDKKIFRYSDVNLSKLLKLQPTESMPDWSQSERYFERPWMNHFNGDWLGQILLPTQMNQAYYGREFARIVSQATLMLNTDASDEQKKKLLIGVLQLGIDLRGIVEIGGSWNRGGGLTSGRKWPIFFSYLMFDDPYFKDMPATAIFHEDAETYYGKGWAGQAALWQIINHHGARKTYMEQTPDTWATWDMQDGHSWGLSSEAYRLCCNTEAWAGQSLSTLLMGGKEAWNHNAYFDNVEDWMRIKDIYSANRGKGFPRPEQEGACDFGGNDNFVNEMWIAYRKDVPKQTNGISNKKWDYTKQQWLDNEIMLPIEDKALTVGEVAEVNISTIFANSKVKLSLEVNDVPSFCKFIDNGNGTGVLAISPSEKGKGDYTIVISAKSKSFTTYTQNLKILIK
ncbi:MAG: hypothetical protein KAH10_04985 [Flavobacteriales bacterium]|nr:hypothetical protein [Flavobacteriales bacterium]